MMPQSSQNLYFHLGMNADDDGFCEHFGIMRMTDSKPDDLKVLQAKGFVRVFDDKVLVILDWKENNYLRSDRYSPSKYLEIYKKEIKELVSSGIPDGNQMATQVRLGKDRIKDTTAVKPQNDGFKKVIEQFYSLKGWPLEGNPKLFARYLRAAKELYELCEGNLEDTRECLEKIKNWAGSRDLDWSIETVFKKWYDLDELKPKEKKPYYEGKRIFQKVSGGKWWCVSQSGEIKELGIGLNPEQIIYK